MVSRATFKGISRSPERPPLRWLDSARIPVPAWQRKNWFSDASRVQPAQGGRSGEREIPFEVALETISSPSPPRSRRRPG